MNVVFGQCGKRETVTTNERRLYRIKPDEGYFFYADVTPDNKQVLMGVYCPNLIAFFFDSDGNLLSFHQRSLGVEHPHDGPYNVYSERISQQLSAWQLELGFQPTTIKVKKFFQLELKIGIQDQPDHFGEMLFDPQVSEDEKKEVRDSIRRWEECEQFVLWWGNDYWLDKTGEVVSS